MRLLKRGPSGELSLTKDLTENIPAYAILSHTWGPDEDEVTFEDIEKQHANGESGGFAKLRFCATDIAAASNYKDRSDRTWEEDFRKSRWFTRGWTLQELLAPAVVEFFSREGTFLGSKETLEELIHNITKIPISALRGEHLSQFSIEARLGWAARRVTKKREDKAYCLLGIFNVFMPLIYGEGENAFRRLRYEISRRFQAESSPDLPLLPSQRLRGRISEAFYKRANAIILRLLNFRRIVEGEESIDPAHRNTLEWALEGPSSAEQDWSNLLEWFRGDYEIYWICGKAGSGKSTLMKFLATSRRSHTALAEWAASKDIWMASDYFWRLGSSLQNSQEGLLRSLLFSTLREYPSLIHKVFPELHMNILETLDTATSDTVVEPLSLVELKTGMARLVDRLREAIKICLFIDGVDEYSGNPAEILRLLRSLVGRNVKIVLSSRPIPVCKEELKGYPKLRLENLTHSDIVTFVEDHVQNHTKMQQNLQLHLRKVENLIHDLASKSCGVFLWVSLVCKELDAALIDGDTIDELLQRLHDLPSELNDLYERMMDQMSGRHKKEGYRYLKIVLTCTYNSSFPLLTLEQMVFTERIPELYPLTREKISKVLGSNLERRATSLRDRLASRCCGLVEVRDHGEVSFLHKSVADFLHQNATFESTSGTTSGIDNDFHQLLANSYLFRLSEYDVLRRVMDRGILMYNTGFDYLIQNFVHHLYRSETVSRNIDPDLFYCFVTILKACRDDTNLYASESMVPRELYEMDLGMGSVLFYAYNGLTLHLESFLLSHDPEYLQDASTDGLNIIVERFPGMQRTSGFGRDLHFSHRFIPTIEVLLKNRADFNQRAWSTLLKVLVLKQRRSTLTPGRLYSLLQTVLLFLKFGASPSEEVSVDGEGTLSASSCLKICKMKLEERAANGTWNYEEDENKDEDKELIDPIETELLLDDVLRQVEALRAG